MRKPNLEDILTILNVGLFFAGIAAAAGILVLFYGRYGSLGYSFVFVPIPWGGQFRLAHLWPGLALLAFFGPYALWGGWVSRALAWFFVGLGLALTVEDVIEHQVVGTQPYDSILPAMRGA